MGDGVPATRFLRAVPIGAAFLAARGRQRAAPRDRSGVAKTRALDAARRGWPDGLHTPGTARLTGRSAFSSAAPDQHGFVSQHLPAVRENVELVGKLEMNTPAAFRSTRVPATADRRAGRRRGPDRGLGGLQELRLSRLVVGAVVRARRILLGRHLRPEEPAAAGVRARPAGDVPRRGNARDHLPGTRHPGRQQRAVRSRRASAGSTSTT